MYGLWENNIPSGINVIKNDSCLLFIDYKNGRITGNLLGIF